MSTEIYPDGIRMNCFASDYCEIAMEAYYKASKSAETLKLMGYTAIDTDEIYSDMNKNIIVAIVFSAMSLESFFNDYAAACLGDSEFYNNFDKLSEISKFELIAKFILKTSVNKEKSYYCHLKSLTKNRNSYVHNKSQGMNADSILAEYAVAYNDNNDKPIYDAKIINHDLKDALIALKAIRDIAMFFDKHDSSVHVLSRFFGVSRFSCESEYKSKYKDFVYSELGIKRTVP